MADRFDLTGKVVVITGGTGILGANYCQKLAEAGATVVVADLDEARCAEAARGIAEKTGTETVGIAVDLACEESVQRWARTILERFGRVDVLVNNAATKSPGFFAPLEKFSVADWNQVMAVNVTGMFLATRELGPSMAERGKGSIINISSIYGVVGPDQRIYEGSWYEDLGGSINTPLIYSATKGAVVAMSRYLATYWGGKGVRTNTLTPGGVSSGQNGVFYEKYSARVPMGRMATADEMVGALIFLASDASSYVNGQNIIVDGGLTAW
ncbi:SDR family oxidoreductase [Geomonas nitrogeniifigens]|uniref:SDR family oxidoreductase n=1 Tax=Geomonas diazotrophica TaxID=2843197 RepID=A0ABX8JDW7_9BACT|nr:SDR family oxidoreductase [Geomonas nitrogeniifigens]QWV95968.1 SDR family oxidoreductase [Geomonas nitrogeniifigens]